MAYVITRLCIDCKDMGCVEACPVECIYEHEGPVSEARPDMLYIHPTECINCGACAPDCPWEAIFEDLETPELFRDDIALNAQVEESKDDFVVATLGRDPQGRIVRAPKPTRSEVDENKRKWGA